MRSRSVALACAIVLATSIVTAAPTVPPPSWLVDQVRILAAPEMDGRASGSAGGERAGRYLAGAFKAAGLQPRGDNGTYLQSFHVPTGIALGPSTRFDIKAPVATTPVLRREWTPLAVSAEGVEEGEVVFTGYGI